MWGHTRCDTWSKRGDRRTTGEPQFSPSAVWVPRVEPGCQAWHQALLPAEPSQQPSAPSPILLFSFLLLFLESGSPVAQADLKLVAEDDLAS